jgi:hypothetical protein
VKRGLLLLALLASSAGAEVLKITVTPKPDDESYATSRRLVIDVMNLSGKSVDITNATLELPKWYAAKPRAIETRLTDIEGDLDSQDTETQTVPLSELTARQAFLPLFTTPPLFLYKKLRGTVTIRYQYANEKVEQEPITYEYTLPAEAPLWHVLFGGWCGTIIAFLIALLAQRADKTKPQKTWYSLALAILTVPVLILVARLTTNILPLPITIDLRDAAGGFLIGICSVWITPPIVDRILGGPPAKPAREGGGQLGTGHTEEHTSDEPNAEAEGDAPPPLATPQTDAPSESTTPD